MTLNSILHDLYSILNELENDNQMVAEQAICDLIDKFEAKLPYKQDSYGELDKSKDIELKFES